MQTGGASGTLNNVVPSATSGIPLISQGSSSQPTFGTAVVGGGGTGVTSVANTSALLASGTTTTGNFQNIASVATGQVLTSAGTSTLPAWSATPTVTSINLGNTTLTTYIEGTWTPNLQIGGSNTGITYSFHAGWYTQINNLVIVSFRVALTSQGSNTGAVTISNFPVTTGTNGGNFSIGIGRMAQTNFPAGYTLVSIGGAANSTVWTLGRADPQTPGAVTNVLDSDISNAFSFQAVGHYYIL